MYLFQARCLRNVEKVNRYVEALESGAGVNGKMVVNLGGCQKYSENYAGGVYEEGEFFFRRTRNTLRSIFFNDVYLEKN